MANLIGQKFGRLLVLEKTDKKKNGSLVWLCQCDCGNYKEVSTRELRSPNHAKSCGCLQKERTSEACRKDLTGMRSGRLVALEPTEQRKKNEVVWKCQCDCGNIHYVPTSLFTSQKVQSCGCLVSKGNQKIHSILQENNILFIPEYPVRIGEANYYFDFAILGEDSQVKLIIEYDGLQHFSERAGWRESLETIQRRDMIKNQWCQDRAIPLLRIPYTDFELLSINYLKEEVQKLCMLDL